MLGSTALVGLPISPPAANADTSLVAQAQRGHIEAFEQLYRAHAPRVFGLCSRLCGDRSAAEGLTQDVFVRAWEKLGSFRGDASFSTWLHRLAVNAVLADRRSSMRRLDREQRVPHHESQPGPHGKVDASVDLERAMSGLPRRARMVFVLHEIEGLRHEEIATMMNITAGTSKGQLHRARQLLREALQ
ncbi:MAG: RNA polymerase sigma factor [Deltaproteobacteria bacterium]|nr:RNA polymerase sigma factor [Deltaproteobacteria bacterium]